MISLEEIRSYCLAKPNTSEELPFDEVTLVFKIMGKMFAITPLDDWGHISLKSDPDEALERRARYETVQPGYHMNNKHWITAPLDGSVPRAEVFAWIDDSYRLVIAKFPKAKRGEALAALEEWEKTRGSSGA
jgi:predicted DNA-binding protein (MmcQ/YjbR family)